MITYQDEIIAKIIAYLQLDDAKTISSTDFEEKRESSMIVVGIDRIENLNFNLPDFKYNATVLVDCVIDDSKDAEDFEEIRKEVSRRLYRIALDKHKISEMFEEIPVVYFNIDNEDFSINERSYRQIFNISLIASF